jgi:hypothetical protein
MRPAFFSAFILLLAALPAGAEDRLLLADGTSLTVDAAPEVKGATVFFSRDGLSYSLPLVRVDLPATQAANRQGGGTQGQAPGPPVLGAPPQGSPAPPPRRFTDEDLRDPANHLSSPAPPEQGAKIAASGQPLPQSVPGPQRDRSDLAKWSELSREEKGLLAQRNSLEERIRSLEDRRPALDAEDANRRSDYDRYPTDPSVLATAQDWAQEYQRRSEAIADELADLRSRKAQIDRQVRDVQLEMRDLSIAPENGRVP